MTSPLTAPLTRPLTYPLTAPLGSVMGWGGGAVTPAPLYVGLLGTRAGIPNNIANLGKVNAQRVFYANEPFSDIGVDVCNFYVDGTTEQETGAGGAVSVTAALTTTAGVLLKRITFGGSNTGSVADGTIGSSDLTPTDVTYPAGWYAIRMFLDWSAGSGQTIYTENLGNGIRNLPLGDACEFGATVDKTDTGASISAAASSSMVMPGAIFATIRGPGIALFGDSRVQGVSDDADSTGDIGLTARSIGYQHFGYTNLARYGGHYGYMAMSGYLTNRLRLAARASHWILGPATNDLRSGTAVSTVEGYYATIIAYGTALGIPCDICSMERVTTGSWDAADGSDQIPNGSEANRVTFNSHVMAKSITGQRYGYDTSTPTALVNLGVTHDEFWQPGTTEGGIHDNYTGSIAIKNSGNIPPSNYKRVAPTPAPSPFFSDARTHINFAQNLAWWNNQQTTAAAQISCARTGTAKNARNAAGAFSNFAANTPALTDLGLSVEEGRSDIVGFSNAINSTNWVATNITATAGQASPDGNSTASLLNENTTGSAAHSILPASKSVVTSTTYIGGMWAKADTASCIQLFFAGAQFSGTPYANFDLSAGTFTTGGSAIGAGMVQLASTGWWYCWLADTSTAVTGARPLSINMIPNTAAARNASYAGTGKQLYIWNPQMYAALSSSLWFPGSPLITASSVTLVAPADNITMAQTVGFVPGGQTIYLKARVPLVTLPGAIAFIGNGDKGVSIGLDSGGNRMRLQVMQGSQRGDTGSNAATMTASSIVKAALSYDGAGLPLFSVNGSTVAIDATPTQADFDTNALQIGARNTGTPANFWNDFVQELAFLPVKNQAELNAMTT